MKMLFTRNGGTPVMVSSIEDIKKNLGDMLQGFDDVEIDGSKVLARIGIDYIPVRVFANAFISNACVLNGRKVPT